MGSRLSLQNSEMSSESVTPRAENGFILNSGGSSSYSFNIWPSTQPQPILARSLAEKSLRDKDPYFYQGIVPTQEGIEMNDTAFMRFNEEDREAYEKRQLVLIGNKTIIPPHPLQNKSFHPLSEENFYTKGTTERERIFEKEMEIVLKRMSSTSVYEQNIPSEPKLVRTQRRLRTHIPKGKHKKDVETIKAYQKRFNEQKKCFQEGSSSEEEDQGPPAHRHPPANRRVMKRPPGWKYQHDHDFERKSAYFF